MILFDTYTTMTATAFYYYCRSILRMSLTMNWWQWVPVLWRQQVWVKVRDMQVAARTPLDIWTIKETILDDCYRFTTHAGAKPVVVDVGAAMGDFTLLAATTAKKVIAYECDPDRVSLLRQTLANSQVAKKVVVVRPQKAVSLRQVLGVQQRCDFLKIDCEGCEYEVLGKATKADLRRVARLAMEVHFFTPYMRQAFPMLMTKLQKAGFQVHLVPNAVHQTIAYVFAWQIQPHQRQRN